MTTLETMENVRLPMAMLKPGFISAATEKLLALIEPTDIVPTTAMARVVPDTTGTASIVLPAAVCVITVNVPAA